MALRRWILCGAALVGAVTSLPAVAQLDTTQRASVLRAGPDAAFPQVTRLPTSANVHLFGCLQNRTWCDVQSGRARGWIRATDLRQTTRVLHPPVVTFSVAEYWDAHYRTRAWYSSRDNWLGWGTPGFRPPAAR
jgi:uncharacterized protein YraI